MKCIDSGILRARLDHELHGPELENVERHLAACADCRRKLEEMESSTRSVRLALEPLAPASNELELDPRLALAHFRAMEAAPEGVSAGHGFFSQVFGRRWAPAWGVALGVALVAAAMSFAPVRSWGQRLLAMLRVQKIEVVSVDPVMPNLSEDRAGKMLGQLISDNVVFTRQPGEPIDVSTTEQASALAGFHVRTITARADAPHLSVEGEQAFHLNLNRERLQAVLEEAGRPDIQLPASIDGAEVAVHIPKAVVARYGEMPKVKEGNQNGAHPSVSSEDPNFLIFAQVPSPTVSVPPNLNIAQVAEAGLELAGLSPEEAQAFVQSVDWTSTLVIPVPRQGASYQKFPVDGTEGTLITSPRRGGQAGYTLIWIKSGIIYSLSGFGDGGNALTFADSLG
ncbi:MAG TPA: zf-HC2 domain-containing protein [Terriglobia bacterium]|nr:zf-HC2 domain-containing protein [Terriglobia bacterium]